MDTARQDQGRERGSRRFDECAAARREGGSFEVSRSDEPKEQSTDPLRGEHTPERVDVTLNSYEEQSSTLARAGRRFCHGKSLGVI
jgi:hypothetical protein